MMPGPGHGHGRQKLAGESPDSDRDSVPVTVGPRVARAGPGGTAAAGIQVMMTRIIATAGVRACHAVTGGRSPSLRVRTPVGRDSPGPGPGGRDPGPTPAAIMIPFQKPGLSKMMPVRST